MFHFAGEFASRVKPHQRDERGFVVGVILAGSFTERRRVGRDIQNVINHLKSQSQSLSVTIEFELSGGKKFRLAGKRAHSNASQNQSARLETVHMAQ